LKSENPAIVKTDRQHNDQRKKNRRINIDVQNTEN
jgi:hypothetical protein